ncbi:MAG: HDIG domain-containing protein [Candidatus Azobacteroides sp.]|nr:HDIG domain-containing protein [Candidatus Azobacteroides sp.]
MIPVEIIKKYYREGTELYRILLEHSFSVADKSLSIAQMHPELNLDIAFIYEAAMLHDIGIFKTNAPDVHCCGEFPYICHGYLGSDILKAEGLPRHALVCERHTGTGLSLETIIKNNLPVPKRDMVPESMEEQLICFSDKFFSKTNPEKEKTIDKIKKNLAKHGEDSVKKFDNWCKLFLG